MTLHALLISDPEGGYVSYNPQTGTTSQGETAGEALANLKEACELYLEECPPSESDLDHVTTMLTTFDVELEHA